MEASLRATKVCTGAGKAVERYGDDLWCAACDHCRLDTRYRINQIAGFLLPEFPFAPSTLKQYLRAVLKAVEDQGNNQVKQVGNFWVFPSCDD